MRFLPFLTASALSILALCPLALGTFAFITAAQASLISKQEKLKIKNTDFTAAEHPYGDADRAPGDIERAFKMAKDNHKLVLLDFGANWCPDCRVLAGIFQNPDLSKWIKQHFILVNVNIGHKDNENMKIAQDLGGTIDYVPTIMILTPDQKLLNKDGLLALGDARKMSVQQVADLLQTWQKRAEVKEK